MLKWRLTTCCPSTVILTELRPCVHLSAKLKILAYFYSYHISVLPLNSNMISLKTNRTQCCCAHSFTPKPTGLMNRPILINRGCDMF